MGVLALLLLPKCFTDLNYGPWPPARDWGSCVSGLVRRKNPDHLKTNWCPLTDQRSNVTSLRVRAVVSKPATITRWVMRTRNGVMFETNDANLFLNFNFGEITSRADSLTTWFRVISAPASSATSTKEPTLSGGMVKLCSSHQWLIKDELNYWHKGRIFLLLSICEYVQFCFKAP